MEARLREAQCSDALVKLRSLLHSKGHLIAFRNENMTGQRKATRSQNLIARVGTQISQHHKKYNAARGALHALKGEDFAPRFKKMETAHLTLDAEEKESNSTSREKLAKMGSGKGRPSRNAPSKHKVLSWIWTAAGVSENMDSDIHECKCPLPALAVR
jgi:hypothetical protein